MYIIYNIHYKSVHVALWKVELVDHKGKGKKNLA